MIRIISTILFTLAVLAAGDAPPTPLPTDAQAAVAKAEKAEAAVQAKANAETLKIRKELIAALTKAQEAATKKGDLNTALAVKAKLEAVVLPEEALLGAAPAAPVANKGVTEADYLGTWQIVGADYAIKLLPARKAQWIGSSTSMPGSYRITPKGAQIEWTNGTYERIVITGPDTSDIIEEDRIGTEKRTKKGQKQ